MVRWYDKNPDLAQVFAFIEKLSEDNKKVIAQNILQLLIEDFNLDTDKVLNEITKSYNYDCKRWYDNNIDLFTSFEIIKMFPKVIQQKIVMKIVQEILNSYIERKY